MYSPYGKQILNNWATQNSIIPQDWKGLVATVLEAGPQLKSMVNMGGGKKRQVLNSKREGRE